MTTTPTSTKWDPFTKVPEGYARPPGAGYAALHPELEDVNPEEYPDIHKMAILADVAPYSREYDQVFPSCRAHKILTRGHDREPLQRSISRLLAGALFLFTHRQPRISIRLFPRSLREPSRLH
ncbi:MAG: hypothetical protein WB679_01700 [Terracidiphilus sp.]